MKELYQKDLYWEKNSSFHEEDAEFKVKHLMKSISNLKFGENSSILEIGCGSGKFLSKLSDKLKGNFIGIDISAAAIKRANNNFKKKNIVFEVTSVEKFNSKNFSLIILNDVIEHIDNYYLFMESIKKFGDYYYFNIPLEINFISIIKNNFKKSYDDVGHLHFFNKDSALLFLNHVGFSIVEYNYNFTAKHNLTRRFGLNTLLAYILFTILKLFSKDLCVKLIGQASLGVLCKKRN